MEAIREVTDWGVEYRTPNHVYLIDGSRMVAYIPYGTGKAHYFKAPLPFDKRGRRFAKVTPNPFKKVQKSNLIEVKGSKGDSYFVDPDAKTCSCVGYQFHGKCKHLKILNE